MCGGSESAGFVALLPPSTPRKIEGSEWGYVFSPQRHRGHRGSLFILPARAASEAYPSPSPSPLKWGGVTRCAEVLNRRGFGQVCRRAQRGEFVFSPQRHRGHRDLFLPPSSTSTPSEIEGCEWASQGSPLQIVGCGGGRGGGQGVGRLMRRSAAFAFALAMFGFGPFFARGDSGSFLPSSFGAGGQQR